MFKNHTIDRLEQMLKAAQDGVFLEKHYDETRLSRLECRWKNFLENSELSRKNLAAEKENIKSLISDISHQTKTPMTNIKLYASLLEESIQRGDADKKIQLQAVSELQRQVEKLEFLTQSLTKISRLESDVYELIPRIQKIHPLILDILEEIRPKAENKKIQMQYQAETSAEQPFSTGKREEFPRNTSTEQTDAGTELTEIQAAFDRKWTREALFNMIDNAVKYSPEKSTITISIKAYEIYTAILIKDEGIGIDEKEIPKIFGRFYRGSKVQQTEGVGIGLYLAREIIKREKGYIKVSSKPGQGTEFAVYLPRE